MKPSENTQEKEAPEYQALSDISKGIESQYLPIDSIEQGDIKSAFYNPKDLTPNTKSVLYEYGALPKRHLTNRTSFKTNTKNPNNGSFRQYLSPNNAKPSNRPKTRIAQTYSKLPRQKTAQTSPPKKTQQTTPPKNTRFKP